MFVSYFELGLSRDYLVSFKNILKIHILIKYFLINVCPFCFDDINYLI